MFLLFGWAYMMLLSACCCFSMNAGQAGGRKRSCVILINKIRDQSYVAIQPVLFNKLVHPLQHSYHRAQPGQLCSSLGQIFPLKRRWACFWHSKQTWNNHQGMRKNRQRTSSSRAENKYSTKS